MQDEQAFSVIHIENHYASGHQKRPRGPRSKALVGALDTIPQNPLVNLETQANTYYLHFYVQTVEDIPNLSKGVADGLLPLGTSRAECPILDLAVSSLALAVFSRTQRHPPAAIEATKRYQRLLRTFQEVLYSLSETNIDACLLTIFFMSRYEDAVHRLNHSNIVTPVAAAFPSFSHHDGALATLKYWRERLSRHQPATNVIKLTRHGMIRSALMRNLALPEWIIDGSFFGECGFELAYDRIVVRLAGIRHELSMLFNSARDVLPFSTTDLDKELQDVDESLQSWALKLPNAWRHRPHLLSDPYPWPMRDFYSPVVYSYSKIAHAAVWIQYCATRMLTIGTRLRILELMRQDSPNLFQIHRSDCASNIKSMANDLACSIPFCLQRFKLTNRNLASTPDTVVLSTEEEIRPHLASLAVWPLTIASSLVDLDFEQVTWFRSELARLGRAIGVGVLESAETHQWLQL